MSSGSHCPSARWPAARQTQQEEAAPPHRHLCWSSRPGPLVGPVWGLGFASGSRRLTVGSEQPPKEGSGSFSQKPGLAAGQAQTTGVTEQGVPPGGAARQLGTHVSPPRLRPLPGSCRGNGLPTPRPCPYSSPVSAGPGAQGAQGLGPAPGSWHGQGPAAAVRMPWGGAPVPRAEPAGHWQTRQDGVGFGEGL